MNGSSKRQVSYAQDVKNRLLPLVERYVSELERESAVPFIETTEAEAKRLLEKAGAV